MHPGPEETNAAVATPASLARPAPAGPAPGYMTMHPGPEETNAAVATPVSAGGTATSNHGGMGQLIANATTDALSSGLIRQDSSAANTPETPEARLRRESEVQTALEADWQAGVDDYDVGASSAPPLPPPAPTAADLNQAASAAHQTSTHAPAAETTVARKPQSAGATDPLRGLLQNELKSNLGRRAGGQALGSTANPAAPSKASEQECTFLGNCSCSGCKPTPSTPAPSGNAARPAMPVPASGGVIAKDDNHGIVYSSECLAPDGASSTSRTANLANDTPYSKVDKSKKNLADTTATSTASEAAKRECGECGLEKGAGKLDNTDGTWYCSDCWQDWASDTLAGATASSTHSPVQPNSRGQDGAAVPVQRYVNVPVPLPGSASQAQRPPSNAVSGGVTLGPAKPTPDLPARAGQTSVPERMQASNRQRADSTGNASPNMATLRKGVKRGDQRASRAANMSTVIAVKVRFILRPTRALAIACRPVWHCCDHRNAAPFS